MYDIREHPQFSDLLVPYIQNTEVLHVTFNSPVEELAQLLPGFPQSMLNLRSLSLTNWYLNRDESPVDPFELLAPTLSLSHITLYLSFLRLGALTKLILIDDKFDLHPDIFLDFLEGNHFLESVDLAITPTELPSGVCAVEPQSRTDFDTY